MQDAKIEPEEFTTRLQAELKSSPQPYLIPFLKVQTHMELHTSHVLIVTVCLLVTVAV